MTKPVINRKWRTDYVPQIGDIVKFHMFGCRDRVGVVLGIEKQEKDYTTCRVIEEGCLVSYNNKEPRWEPLYALEKVDAKC